MNAKARQSNFIHLIFLALLMRVGANEKLRRCVRAPARFFCLCPVKSINFPGHPALAAMTWPSANSAIRACRQMGFPVLLSLFWAENKIKSGKP
jgi:hypothetical protein